MPTPKRKPKLTQAQVQQLCDAPAVSRDDVVATRDRCLFLLLAATGLRRSEIARIDTRDAVQVSRTRFALRNVRRSLSQKARTVPISKQVYEAIQDWLYVRPVQGPYLFMTTRETGAEGTLWHEAALSVDFIHMTLARYGKRLGFDHLTITDVRSYVARKWFAKLGFRVTRRRLGHADARSTALLLQQEADDVIDTNHLY